MDKKRKHNRLVVAGIAAAFVAAFAAPASAAVGTPGNPVTQTVTGTVGSTISLQLSEDAVTFPTNLAVGANTANGGSLTVDTNVPLFVVQVASSSLTMTDGTKSLAAPLNLTASGAAIATPTAVPVTTTAAPITPGMSVAGLSQNVFDLEFSQAIGLTDQAGTYSTTLTYTGSALP